jgi:predicted ATPase/signal transduction histidine kinase
MLFIPGYRITQKLHQGAKTLVYRGYREADRRPVILKTLCCEFPSRHELSRLQHEYELTRDWDEEGLIRALDLVAYDNNLVLILEDIGAISVKQLMDEQAMGAEAFLPLAIAFAKSLNRIHQHQIIHKDINPANLVVNPQTGAAQIIDFGISSRLSRETTQLQNPGHLEGTLAYLSPEQTGRMNREIDYRSDFYSLGATFYEMLTGVPPFSATDPMELVHCHLAWMPRAPHDLRPALPHILSELVQKLMAKTAEERYQSAFGLIVDLETCQQQLQACGSIAPFALGRQDVSERFQIPQKLYGREPEVQQVLDAFVRVSHGQAEILMVAGYSGVGKTALVHEVYKPITEKHGYFIAGKFDQFQRDIPYACLIEAFQELMRQLLTESPNRIARWKGWMSEALGANAQVIVDVIPEVALILGPQPPVAPLPPAQAQNRFNLMFKQFIRVFTTAEHPLVLFLDDLQWADLPSLQLLKLFLSAEQAQYLLVIGAYRDNEVAAAHPLMLALEEIKQAKKRIDTIELKPLGRTHVQQLLAETLHCDPRQSETLAELCLEKTQGNPFFLNQFLRALAEAKHITFNRATGSWQWDMLQLQQTPMTNNVVELMTAKIQTLAFDTQAVLQLAACVGNHFDLNTLAWTGEQTAIATARALWPALQENLIVPLDDGYKCISLDAPPDANPAFKFVHDRVQQAAYSLIAESSKALFHLRIGRLVLEHLAPGEREERIFDLVYHWNRGQSLLSAQAEKEELARLNLAAGKKAKASAAYKSALAYLLAGLQLLRAVGCEHDGWDKHYELTLALSVEATEAAYLGGDFEQMDALAGVVLSKAKTLLEQVTVYQIQIQARIVQNQSMEAIKIALPVLRRLGVKLPHDPGTLHVVRDLMETKWALMGKPAEELARLPAMTEASPMAAMQLLGSICPAAYVAQPQLVPLISFKLVQLSVRYGNTALSAYAYAVYGVILCNVLGDIDAGYRFGTLAVTVLELFSGQSLRAKTGFVLETLIKHLKDPFQERLPALLEVYQCGVQTGDLEYAAYAAYNYCTFLYFIGTDLPQLQTELEKYAQAIAQFKLEQTLHWQAMLQQTVANLAGQSMDPCRLCGSHYDEDASPIALESRTTKFLFHQNKLILCYLFQQYPQGLEQALAAEEYLDAVIGIASVPVCHFYMALVRLALVAQSAPSERNRLLKKVASIQKKLKKWAHHAPMNHLHKWHLVEAESARVASDDLLAIRHYEQAITLAAKNGFAQEEALASELAARFYFSRSQEKVARTYLQEAHYGYQQWGAAAKVSHLERQYPGMLQRLVRTPLPGPAHPPAHDGSTTVLDSTVLDLATVMKATQAISGEIVLGHLLEKLMRIVIENAGAQHGFLLLETDGEWRIEAEGNVNETTVSVLQSHTLIPAPSLDASETASPLLPLLPVSLIQYAALTKEAVVLDDATGAGRFTTDPYIVKVRPKSVMCAPILQQGKLAGMLYLENNLVCKAFTADRLQVLKILSSQAAISIENARVYENLESTVAQRTAALSESHTALSLAYDVAEKARQQAESAEQKATAALTDLRATQVNLIQSEKMAGLGTLTAGVAHEINNPTNFVHVATQNQRADLEEFERFLMGLLADDPDPDTVAEFTRRFARLRDNLATMLNGTERIIRIVKDLRSFSRLDEAEKKSVPLSECINGTLNLMRSSWLDKVEFITEIAFDPQYDCWPRLINQVFMNLLINGCQAIEAKQQQSGSSERGRLWLRLRQAPGELIAEVEDNGIGIEKAILPRILEPFFTTKEVGSGTGLGLSISYGIIQKHHGTLKINSTPGVGSCFTIHLPYAAGSKE